jgi:hypothetical protein
MQRILARSRYSSLFAYLAPLYPLCRVSTARYRGRDKWKAERLSFTCQIPFLSADAMPETNSDTSCCPEDPFNPRAIQDNFDPTILSLSLQQTSDMCNKRFPSVEEIFEGATNI